MKWEIVSAAFFIASLVAFMYTVKQPEWTTEVMDSVHPERFVSVSAMPSIVYFNEKERGGVLFFASPSEKWGVMNDINYYFKGRQWEGGSVDEGLYKGMFISSTADDKGNIHVSYQDATLGDEKLMHAFYDGNWTKEAVDDVNSGLNVGMYSSISILEGKPVIFYHTEQGRKFGYAIKENGSWSKKTLETGVGWLITTAACDGKVFAAYRGRDTQDIFLGTLENGVWSSRNMGVKTSSGLAIAEKGCMPYIAYFDDSKSSVMFLDATEGKSYRIGSGRLSRVSLAADSGGFHAAYYFSETGLYYAFSKDGIEWNVTLLSPGERDGWYNSIAAGSGNIYISSLNQTSLKYMEYNASASGTIKALLSAAAALLFAASLLIFITKVYKDKSKKK